MMKKNEISEERRKWKKSEIMIGHIKRDDLNRLEYRKEIN